MKTLLVIGGMVLAITGCGSPDPEGGTGDPDGGGGNVGGAVTQEKFITDFYNITCGPSNTEGAMPAACAMSNTVGVDLLDCLWRRADFGSNGSTSTGITDKLRMQLSDGGQTPLCTNVLKTTTCTDYMKFTFGGGTPANVYIGHIWQNSNPKPTNAEGMLGSCDISP
jgi:hypothetical protein